MRTKNVIKNFLASFGSYVLLFGLGVIVRKLFLKSFSLELLGYEGLFGSIFTLLSVAELGATRMFNYMLYDVFAKKDQKEIAVVMAMYKKLYHLVGMIVFIAGIIIYFFLPQIIREEVSDWGYVRLIFGIQLFGTLITYFLAYRRVIFVADQKAYQIVKIETVYNVFIYVLRAAAIVLAGSYVTYLLIPAILSLGINLHIANKSNKNYPYAFAHKGTWNDFKERNVFPQLKEVMANKLATLIYNSADNFIISIILGVRSVGLFANYQMINQAAIRLLNFFTDALNASAGNLVYTEATDQKKAVFDVLDFLGFVLGCLVFGGMATCFQRVIALLYGKQYLVEYAVVLALALDFYIRCRGIAYTSFQGSLGHYETCRNLSLGAAAVNVLMSVVLGKQMGLAGILLATAAGNVLIQAGRAKVVFTWLFDDAIKRVVSKEVFFFCAAILCVTISYLVTREIADTLGGIFISGILTVIVCMGVISVLFCRNKEYRSFLRYIVAVAKNVIKK